MEAFITFLHALKNRLFGQVFLASLLPAIPAGALIWLNGSTVFQHGLKWIFIGMMGVHCTLCIVALIEFFVLRRKKASGKIVPFPEDRLPVEKKTPQKAEKKKIARPQRSILKEAVDF